MKDQLNKKEEKRSQTGRVITMKEREYQKNLRELEKEQKNYKSPEDEIEVFNKL